MSKELDDAISIVLEHATPDEAAVIQGCMSIINQPRILETSVGDIHLFNAFRVLAQTVAAIDCGSAGK